VIALRRAERARVSAPVKPGWLGAPGKPVPMATPFLKTQAFQRSVAPAVDDGRTPPARAAEQPLQALQRRFRAKQPVEHAAKDASPALASAAVDSSGLAVQANVSSTQRAPAQADIVVNAGDAVLNVNQRLEQARSAARADGWYGYASRSNGVVLTLISSDLPVLSPLVSWENPQQKMRCTPVRSVPITTISVRRIHDEKLEASCSKLQTRIDSAFATFQRDVPLPRTFVSVTYALIGMTTRLLTACASNIPEPSQCIARARLQSQRRFCCGPASN
jgi:hypothetical protein